MLDVPVCSDSLFPSSSLDRLSFIFSLSSAEQTAFVEEKHLDLLPFRDGLFHLSPFPLAPFPRSCLKAINLLCLERRFLAEQVQEMLLDVALLPSCQPAEAPLGSCTAQVSVHLWPTRILASCLAFHALSEALISSYCSRRATTPFGKWSRFELSWKMQKNDPQGSVVIYHEDDEEDVREESRAAQDVSVHLCVCPCVSECLL